MKRTRTGLFALFAAALLFVAVEPALAQSVNARLISNLNELLLYVAIPITVLVEGILLYAVVKFRNNDDPQPTRENRRLEITWTIATAIILLFVGVAAFITLANPYLALVPGAAEGQQPLAQQERQPSVSMNKGGAVAPPAGSEAVEIEIIGFQWGWEFHYPEANVTTDKLMIPNGTNVYLHVTSRDVIHSFHVPALGLKQDALPYQYNTIKTKATEPGTYQLYCAEFCGAGHSSMLANVTVIPPEEYQQWLDRQQSGGNSSSSGNASSGNSSSGNSSSGNTSAMAPLAAESV